MVSRQPAVEVQGTVRFHPTSNYEKDMDAAFCGGLFVREGVRACDPFLAARLKIFCVEPNNGNKKVKLYG